MLSWVLRWLCGWVYVEAEGGYPERLLNAIAAADLTVWDVKMEGAFLRFRCAAREYRALRPLARRACVRMRVRQKRGLPFWLFRYRHRKGLAVGLAVYAVVLMLLAPRIWVIQVVGNEQTSAADILAVVQDVGVRIGGRMRAIDRKQLETTGVDCLPTLSWIAVNPSGCVARVEVTERKPTPQVLDLSQPSNMVALRDGRVATVTVVSGQRQVMLGEAVSAGTVLISGRIPQEDGSERLTRSYGEVWAYTERQLTVSVPLAYMLPSPDGFAAVCPTVTFLGWELPLYSHIPTGEEYAQYERRHFLTANEVVLPLGVTTAYYVRLQPEAKSRTEVQARQLAQQRLAAQEQTVFGDNEHIEQTRQSRLENGVYTLTVTYACLENIAVEEPLSD